MLLLLRVLFWTLAAARSSAYYYSYSYSSYSPVKSYSLAIPATETTSAQTLLYEFSGPVHRSCFLSLDVYIFETSKCDDNALKIIDSCEVVISSQDVLASAGPCMLNVPVDGALEAIIPSLTYDRTHDVFVRDIANQYVDPQLRTLIPDQPAIELKEQGYDTFYPTHTEYCEYNSTSH